MLILGVFLVIVNFYGLFLCYIDLDLLVCLGKLVCVIGYVFVDVGYMLLICWPLKFLDFVVVLPCLLLCFC